MLVWQKVFKNSGDYEHLCTLAHTTFVLTKRWCDKMFKNSSVMRRYFSIFTHTTFLLLKCGWDKKCSRTAQWSGATFAQTTFVLTMSFSSSASGRKSISEVSRSTSLLCRLIRLVPLCGDPSRLHISRFCRPLTLPETSCLPTHTPWNKLSSHSHSLKQVVFPLTLP